MSHVDLTVANMADGLHCQPTGPPFRWRDVPQAQLLPTMGL